MFLCSMVMDNTAMRGFDSILERSSVGNRMLYRKLYNISYLYIITGSPTRQCRLPSNNNKDSTFACWCHSPTGRFELSASPRDNTIPQLNIPQINQDIKFYRVVQNQPHYLPYSQILTVPSQFHLFESTRSHVVHASRPSNATDELP